MRRRFQVVVVCIVLIGLGWHEFCKQLGLDFLGALFEFGVIEQQLITEFALELGEIYPLVHKVALIVLLNGQMTAEHTR